MRRYKNAGLVILGRTNLCEMGLKYTTESQLFGPCKNPWDLARSPGGSSGGAAAAVAAGIVPIAHGSDGGGSLRVPAACCGLFAMKPTRGRVSFAPDFGDVWGGMVVQHVITRSVRDSAALLDLTGQPVPGEPHYPPLPAMPYTQAIASPPPRALKIGWTVMPMCETTVHPDCVAAVHHAVALCESLGHAVEEIDFRYDGENLNRHFTTLVAVHLRYALERGAALRQRPLSPSDVEPLTWQFAEFGTRKSGVDYARAMHATQHEARRIARYFDAYDVVLTPTTAQPPARLGTLETPDAQFPFAPFTSVFNQTGQPAMSVPLYWTKDQGLPIGVQCAGRFGDEATLYQLAAQLEHAQPWAARLPAPVGRPGAGGRHTHHSQ